MRPDAMDTGAQRKALGLKAYGEWTCGVLSDYTVHLSGLADGKGIANGSTQHKC